MSKPTDHRERGVRGMRPAGPFRDLDAPRVAAQVPLVQEITVGWGDCDPAQIAYTANIPAWGLLAVEAWYKACLGVNWYEINLDHGVGTPFVSLGFDFVSPVTPRAPLLVSVYVERLGRSSLGHVVEARQEDAVCFYGRTTAAFVGANEMKAVAIPDNMRASIEDYLARQGPLPEWKSRT